MRDHACEAEVDQRTAPTIGIANRLAVLEWTFIDPRLSSKHEGATHDPSSMPDVQKEVQAAVPAVDGGEPSHHFLDPASSLLGDVTIALQHAIDGRSGYTRHLCHLDQS